MTMGAIVFTFFFSLLINECSDLSPWLADKLVRWSARLRCDEPVEAEALAEELAAYIEDRPGKLFKLLSSLGFVGSGLARRVHPRRPFESFVNQTASWGDMLQGFCLAAGLSSTLLVSHGKFTVAALLTVVAAMGAVSERIKKSQANGSISRLQRPYTLGLIFVLVPGIYISCIAVTVLTLVKVVSDHQPWLVWLGLLANVALLQVPVGWHLMARTSARLRRSETERAQASHP